MPITNQITDPQFDLGYWYTDAFRTIVTDAAKAQAGTKYLQIQGVAGAGRGSSLRVDASNGAVQKFPVKPKDSITISGYIYRESGDQTGKIVVRYYDRTGTFISSNTTPNVTAAAWTLSSETQVVPNNAVYCTVEAYTEGGTVASVFRFDTISFTYSKVLWPSTLPNPDYGWNEGEVENMFIRSNNDAGVPKQRLRYTAVAVPITAQVTMTREQYVEFNSFVKDDLKYVLPFLWSDMLTDEGLQEYRLTKKPSVSRVGYDEVTVALSIEKMP